MIAIQIIDIDEYTFGVKFKKYYKPFIDLIKTVPSAQYDRDNNLWTVLKLYEDEFYKVFKDYVIPKDFVLVKPPLRPINKQVIEHIPLKDFQWDGVTFCVNRLEDKGFALICDTMGLGKTIQSIATAEYMMKVYGIDRVFVVTLNSVKHQFAQEVMRFTRIPVVIIDGTAQKRKRLYMDLYDFTGFIVLNYDLTITDTDELQKLVTPTSMVIYDEIHKLKNRQTKKFKACKKIFKKTVYRIGLTGTPIMNHVEDLYSIFDVLSDGYFGKYTEFKSNYLITEFNGRYEEIIGYKNLTELKQKIHDCIIRRTDKDIDLGLPELNIQNIEVEPADEIIEIHSKLEDRMYELIQKQMTASPKQKALIDNQILSLLSVMILVTDTPEALLYSSSKTLTSLIKDYTPRISPKLSTVIELIENIVENDEKVVVFSSFYTPLKVLSKYLKNIPHLIYHGQLNAQQRDEMVKRFRTSEYNVLLSTDAGSTGLNLQVARTLINLDLPWNPAVLDQRIGRVRRIGTKYQRVNIYNVICKNTIDEKLLQTIDKKREIFDLFIENRQTSAEVG